jgi:hypothetical protein
MSKPMETSAFYKAFHKNSGFFMERLMKDADGKLDPKKTEVTQRFNEFAWRLDQRFLALKNIEQAMFFHDPSKMIYTTHDVQHEFVNRTEAYFQQLYASMSAFVLYISFIGSHKIKQGLPIKSIKLFLKHIESVNGLDIKNEVQLLEYSRDFRAKFIDHTQQHILHDWETFSRWGDAGNECVVIYFIKKGPEVYFRGEIDPYSPTFKPSSNHESFYVSPPHEKCHSAFFKFCEKVIDLIHKDNLP